MAAIAAMALIPGIVLLVGYHYKPLSQNLQKAPPPTKLARQGCNLLPSGDPRRERIAYESQGSLRETKVEADLPTIQCSKTACSSAFVNPALYQGTFENERLAYTGTFTNSMTGKQYNTYEKDPPPATGQYQNMASERHLERLQGFGGFWQSKLGNASRKEPPPFQDVEYPEARFLNVVGGVNDQRSELRDMVNRDISLNMNSFRPDGKTTGIWASAERPPGYTGYVKTRRDVPYMPVTMRDINKSPGHMSHGQGHEAPMARPNLEPEANKSHVNPHTAHPTGVVRGPAVIQYSTTRPPRDRNMINKHAGAVNRPTGPHTIDYAERRAGMKTSNTRERSVRPGNVATGSAHGWRVVDGKGIKKGIKFASLGPRTAGLAGGNGPPLLDYKPGKTGNKHASSSMHVALPDGNTRASQWIDMAARSASLKTRSTPPTQGHIGMVTSNSAHQWIDVAERSAMIKHKNGDPAEGHVGIPHLSGGPSCVDHAERNISMRKSQKELPSGPIGMPAKPNGPSAADLTGRDFRTGRKSNVQNSHLGNIASGHIAPKWVVHSTKGMRLSDKSGNLSAYGPTPHDEHKGPMLKATHTKVPHGLRAYQAKVGSAHSHATNAPILGSSQGRIASNITSNKTSKLHQTNMPDKQIAAALRASDTRLKYGTLTEKSLRTPVPNQSGYGTARTGKHNSSTGRETQARMPALTRHPQASKHILSKFTSKRD